MTYIEQVWCDLLCSNCYGILGLYKENDVDYVDVPLWCEDCEDHMFPIVIIKREYDTRIEIFHVGGSWLRQTTGIVRRTDDE